ncbi:zinc metalloprotease HtpX [archaeon]|nr:zinc metalloprotease HtpX [archaeon]
MFKNQLKTILLLGLLSGLLLWVGQLFGGINGLSIMLVFSLLMNLGTYWFSDKIVLKMYGAKPVSKTEAPGVHKIVEELSKTAEIPKPKIYLVNSEVPNAFATGRNPQNAAIAVTSGILKVLDKEELKGVLAHELAHVKNRDTLITTIAATIASVISYIAYMAHWAALFGGFGSRDNDRGGSDIISFLVLVVLTPIVAALLQLALSRSREFLADESGAKYCNAGLPLASALHKLETAANLLPLKGNSATGGLFIVNPFRGQALVNLFSTHPSTSERAKRLKAMKF